jgi:hypothetical protein
MGCGGGRSAAAIAQQSEDRELRGREEEQVRTAILYRLL